MQQHGSFCREEELYMTKHLKREAGTVEKLALHNEDSALVP